MIINRIIFLKKCVLLNDVLITTLMLPLSIEFYKNCWKIPIADVSNFFSRFFDINFLYHSSILILIVPLWYLTLHYYRAYNFFRSEFLIPVINPVIKASMTVSLLLIFLFFMLSDKIVFPDFKGYLIVPDYRIALLYPFFSAVALCFSRILLISAFRLIQKRGYNLRQIIIIGTGPRSIKHSEKIIDHPEWGFRILGFVTLEKNDAIPEELSKFPVLGSLDEIETILNKNHADEIFFIVPRSWLNKIENAVMCCDIQGITVHIAVDLFSIKVSKTAVSTYYKLPVLSLNSSSTNYTALTVKRFMDIIFALSGIILFLPVGCLIAVAVKLESKGPVFFIQKRSGMHGKEFPMLKFRTMVCNAEKLLNHLRYLNQQDGPVFKMKQDPRVTKVGRILRKFSLDEMPQLVNVLLGQMSIVGPRPPIPSEVELYEPWQKRRLSMRPGITCIWQVSGRNEINFERWMEMDLYYIDNWSLGMDFKLLLKTIPFVIIAKGNYY